jgi:hypothetical protein
MTASIPDIDDLSVDELKMLVLQLVGEISALKAENAAQREEIARLKGLPARPKIRPSGMETATDPKPAGGNAEKRRRGGVKRAVIEERVITVATPPGSRFKGYETTVVQNLVVRPLTIRYRRERWRTPSGETIVAPLPPGVRGHFGPELRRYVLALYHQGQMTVPGLLAHLDDLGVVLSKRQLVRLLIDRQERFVDEARDVLRAGLETAAWLSVDDTGARHKGANATCTQIGNDHFAWFATTGSKSRLNFLELPGAGHADYVINDDALAYMRQRNLAGPLIARLQAAEARRFADLAAWTAHLDRLGLSTLTVNPDPVRIATEGALWGSIVDHGFLSDAVILSDDAGQFNVGEHALDGAAPRAGPSYGCFSYSFAESGEGKCGDRPRTRPKRWRRIKKGSIGGRAGCGRRAHWLRRQCRLDLASEFVELIFDQSDASEKQVPRALRLPSEGRIDIGDSQFVVCRPNNVAFSFCATLDDESDRTW